ncbi:MAG: Rrf2 family transcriptional regulator [Gammaproteobacteria bacterium]|nr:Rrf2 family transcriptional regulator [Gammaproteobacteria bacterium]
MLLYLALLPKEQLATITDIADSYGISRNHLVKVVHNLASLGYVASLRGKGGGLRLACDPAKVTIAEVVRHTEPSFDLVECFRQDGTNTCPITPICRLKRILAEAQQQFIKVLENTTLADVLDEPKALALILRVSGGDIHSADGAGEC